MTRTQTHCFLRGLPLAVAMVALWAASVQAQPAPLPATQPTFAYVLEKDLERQYAHLLDRLVGKLSAVERSPARRQQTFRAAALIQPADRDPVDVVLRQTQAMLESLRGRSPWIAARFQSPLAALGEAIAKATPPSTQPTARPLGKGRTEFIPPPVPLGTPRYAQYLELCKLQRRIAMADPLLAFEAVLFARRTPVPDHHASIHYGLHNMKGHPDTAICRLTGWKSDQPLVQSLTGERVVESGRFAGTPLPGGIVGFPSLSFDGRTILFSWTPARMVPPPPGHSSADGSYVAWRQGVWSAHQMDNTWKVLAMGVDGGPIRMLADDAANNCAPAELPDGRIVYVSDRRGGVARCGGPTKSQVLHTMNADGSNVTAISVAEISEYRPSVLHDGKIIYTRWDYVDRNDTIAHHPWVIYPDGHDERAPHGNYPTRGQSARPDTETDLKAIPSSHRVIGTATGHHGPGHNGSIVILDLDLEDDNAMSQVRRVTPEVVFPEAEGWPEARFRSPWPLDEEHYLCAYQRPGGVTGIYYVDAFGNRVLLYQQPAPLVVTDPIPLMPRKRPPVIPSRAPAARAPTGAMAILNIYESDMSWPAGTRITGIRVVQIFPKSNYSWMGRPEVGKVLETTVRSVLGTAPVETDGSAYFTVPADVPLYLQAIDENGRAVGTMRSTTHVPGGTVNTCVGCHEQRTSTPRVASRPLALRREPSKLAPGPSGSAPIHYPTLVQPVLNRHCVSCHQKEAADNRRVPDLRGTPVEIIKGPGPQGPGTWWSQSYLSMTKAFGAPGGSGKGGPARSIHGKEGTFASKLYPFVTDGKHHDVKLGGEDLLRLVIWQDNNSNFKGSYHEPQRSAAGPVAELPEAIQPETIGARLFAIDPPKRP